MSNGTDPAAAPAGLGRPGGFIQQTAEELSSHLERLAGMRERLNELGGRLIGVDQLPRNQRDKVREEAATDTPTPVRSDTEKVQHQIKSMAIMADDLQEIIGFLEQL